MNEEVGLAIIQKLSTESVRDFHESIRKALDSDDQNLQRIDPFFGVRELSDWRVWRDMLEMEMRGRQVDFEPITW